MLAADGSGVRRHHLLARESEYATRLLRHHELLSLRRRKVSKAAMSGLARDPQGTRQVAERAAAGKPTADLLAGEDVKLATQLDQRLECTQRILSIGRLLSQTAETLFGSRHLPL